jgi:hypothetical protein
MDPPGGGQQEPSPESVNTELPSNQGVVAMEPNNQEPKADVAVYLWVLSLSVGLAIGAGLGVVIGSIGAGIAVGVGAGVTVGLFLYRRSTTNSSDD